MMKKILFILLLSSAVFAQTTKGTFAISGATEFSFSSNKSKSKYNGQQETGAKISTLTLSPGVAYFIIDNLALGLDLEYVAYTNKYKTEIENFLDPSSGFTSMYVTVEQKIVQTTFAAIPSATYFFATGKARPYIGAGLGIASLKETTTYKSDVEINATPDNTKSSGLAWGATAGLAYFVTNKVSFDLGLAYSKYSFKEDGLTTKIRNIGASVGVSVYLFNTSKK